MKVRVQNRMQRDYILNLSNGSKVKILPGLSMSVDKPEWDLLLKGNRALRAMLDMKRLTTSESATEPVEMKPVEDEALVEKSGDAVKPSELSETADAKDGKVQHEVKEVEMVEVDAPKPKKQKSKKKK